MENQTVTTLSQLSSYSVLGDTFLSPLLNIWFIMLSSQWLVPNLLNHNLPIHLNLRNILVFLQLLDITTAENIFLFHILHILEIIYSSSILT